jgi:hypothetical protein
MLQIGSGKEAFLDTHEPTVFGRESKRNAYVFLIFGGDIHIDEKLPYLPLDHRYNRISEPYDAVEHENTGQKEEHCGR